jgi:hypothetical protein
MDIDLAGLAASRSLVLVEGDSDKAALETLAMRRGRNLTGEGVAVVAMGGATNIGRFLALAGPRGLGLSLAGLCDAGEEDHVRRALARAGAGRADCRAALEELGFWVCSADLEDELIRAAGVPAVERVIRSQGELKAFRTFQRQPAQQDVSVVAQLHRFMGTRSGRKRRYATLLALAIDPTAVPRPLAGVLASCGERQPGRARHEPRG